MPLSDLPAIVAEWQARQKPLALYRDYYNGDHQLGFASPKFRQQYRWLLRQSRENLMPATVKAFTDLKRIEAWTNAEAIDEAAERGMRRLAGMVNREEFRAGNAFTLTWTNSSGDRQAVYQHPGQIVPRVDDENPDVLLWAARVWVDGFNRGRVNIYHADRCERFATKLPLKDGAGHRLRDMPDAELGWAPYSDDMGGDVLKHDFGAVPVCWWKRDADDPWSWGRSVLDDAIPVQDELNYLVAVSNGAVERAARPIRYALVSSPEIVGAANARVDFDPSTEDVLTLTANTAGQFGAPDMAALVALQQHAEQKIARVVGIPPYVFSQMSGEVPSGVSLRVVNERRTSAVNTSNDDDTPVWRGQMDLLGFEDCEPLWAPTMPLTEEEAVTIASAEKNDLGLPADHWLRTIGLDPSATDANGVTLDERVASSVQQVAQTFLNGDAPATY